MTPYRHEISSHGGVRAYFINIFNNTSVISPTG
nr:MAG TPA_asm: hypothetical protein [Caudoviricetes sp.]